ncbi:DUF4426 domain-containing protein [Aliidiomarina minuta]|uniref:DUF4426 domain-containing protein n=1 Tax=Aliidiomarina minuta TaxID=880057 RepID=A0A432W164_9GAMM|nr:DUF4426 domain-containing protein [Aliidiomarina minuta]RUO22961.1 DUF4426 domain-containing protein [Aliidiomarina minuta]
MKIIRTWCLISTALLLSITALSAPALATDDLGQNMQKLGDWEVHYSAFPSTFLQPQVASQYDLTRSNSRGVINISVLDATSEQKTPQRVSIEGHALNDLGQRRDLQFRRFIDGDAIYYITQIPHRDDDEYRFFISIRQGDTTQELTFKHTFYRD